MLRGGQRCGTPPATARSLGTAERAGVDERLEHVGTDALLRASVAEFHHGEFARVDAVIDVVDRDLEKLGRGRYRVEAKRRDRAQCRRGLSCDGGRLGTSQLLAESGGGGSERVGRRAQAFVGSYRVTIVVTIRDGRAQCDSLAVENRRGREPITATVLREIPVASIVEQVVLGVFGTPYRKAGKKQVPIATQELVEARADRLPRRVLMPKVVESYKEAIALQDRAPIKSIAAKLAYDAGYISKLVSEARAAKLLGPARPGVAELLPLEED